MKLKLHETALVAALALAGTGSVYAVGATENDALGIADAHISLTEAIAAAEQHGGGKASRAEYERHEGRSVFEVEVVDGSKVTDVKVDPASGQVLAATEDQHDADREDESESAD